MEPMPLAIESVKKLAQEYDLYVLSTAPWKNPSAWSDKLEWIPLIISHHKNLNKGDYLIDDRGPASNFLP